MTFGKTKPKAKALEIKANYTCNTRCCYCCISNRENKRTMSHADIAENIDYFIDRYQIEEVCLSGGEPTVHPSFLDNLEYVRHRNLRLYLHSNGIRFHDREFARRCAELIDRVLVGFSFYDQQSCSLLTGSDHDFDQRVAGIRNLQEFGVPVRTNTVIVKENCRDLVAIARMLGSLGLKKVLFTLPFFFERTEEQVDRFVPESFAALQPSLQEGIGLLEERGIKVSLQGLPACRLGDLQTYMEQDPDRFFVDNQCQKENHRFLFSDMLGYRQNADCRDCGFSPACWGFPQPGALGALEEETRKNS